MAIVQFTIPGRLTGKGRPRFVRATGRVYTPAETQSMEAVVRHFASQAMKGRPPFQGPLKLFLTIRINHPASWSKRRKAETVYVTGKPDADNQIKVFDAANGVLWRDDSQIALIEFDRRYADGPEFVDVAVHELTISEAA